MHYKIANVSEITQNEADPGHFNIQNYSNAQVHPLANHNQHIFGIGKEYIS